MNDDRRALRELARLYDVQESYKDVFGRRVRAGVDSTIAVLHAMGAPISTLQDATSALRTRTEELARRPLEPVIVAWDGRLSEVEVRVPASRTPRELHFAVTGEGDEPEGWSAATATEEGPSEAGSMRVRLPIGHRLPPGRHELWVDAGGDPVKALVLSAPRKCPQPAGRWWGVFAPLYALRAEDDWGVGSFAELGDLRRWVEDGPLRSRHGRMVREVGLAQPRDPLAERRIVQRLTRGVHAGARPSAAPSPHGRGTHHMRDAT